MLLLPMNMRFIFFFDGKNKKKSYISKFFVRTLAKNMSISEIKRNWLSKKFTTAP